MDNADKFAFPLTIAATILAIWFYLRKSPSTPIVTNSSAAPFYMPGVPPIAPTLYYPQQETLGTSATMGPAGTNIGTDPVYNQAAVQNPLVNVPIKIDLQITDPVVDYAGLPPNLLSNLPPWKNGQMNEYYTQLGIPADGFNTPGAGGKSCGCGCGGGSKSKCGQQRNPNKLLDGSTACFTPLYSPGPIPTDAVQYAGAMVQIQNQNANPFHADNGGIIGWSDTVH